VIYCDSSVWFAGLNGAHEGHRAASELLEAQEFFVWHRFLALEVEHAIRRIRDDAHRSAALELLLGLFREGVLVESEELNRCLVSAMAEAATRSARHTKPGDVVGAADLLHLVMAERARAPLVTRDTAQAEFAQRIGMSDVQLLTAKGIKSRGSKAVGQGKS
jgi:predicted nucleic acid-binding protein